MQSSQAIQFYDYHPEPSDFFSEVIEGLSDKQKYIPPKFFYDRTGSELFEAICETKEYYPTRTEQAILQDNVKEIAHIIGRNCVLLEPGSGNCEKVRLLLDVIKPSAYVPMDISRIHLKNAAQCLSEEYPWLDVLAACVDFTKPLELSFCPDNRKKIAFFPGSSIGNFEPSEAIHFMSHVADTVEPGGGMLIGVDLKKDRHILDAAYNDKAGITARFNLNILDRINHELNGNFDLDNFEHYAFYNELKGRVEMHLRSMESQQVTVDNTQINLDKNETIHTENSYKYTIDEFQSMAEKAGFEPVYVWTDPQNLFSVHYFEVPAS